MLKWGTVADVLTLSEPTISESIAYIHALGFPMSCISGQYVC